MKKITMFLMLVMVLAVQTLSARSAKDLINEYKAKNRAEYTYVSPAMMLLVKAAAVKYDKDVAKAIDKVTGVRILKLDACKTKVKKKFLKELDNIDEEEYQPLVMKDNAYDGFRVLVKMDADVLSEVVAYKANYDNCLLIEVEGRIAMDDIQKLLEGTKVLEDLK
nr:DUF4252 domain-containing protein [uncultured Prevotella sp.]